MARPTFLMAEPEPDQAISARKLVLETAKFNVITAHSAREATELCQRFPKIDALIVHGSLKGECAKVVAQFKRGDEKKPAILLAPSASASCDGVDHSVSSHSPEELLRLLRQLFGDPRKIDGK
ncbi:MAG TPA: response regulator [Terriglobales bacterium]|nr:response regulator [Terriglobales bacterium]